jgi:hypothetical protein
MSAGDKALAERESAGLFEITSLFAIFSGTPSPTRALAGLKVEKASIEGQQEVADADLGPVRYLATPATRT